MRIQIPKLLVELRQQTTAHTPRSIRLGLAGYAWLTTRPLLFRVVTRGAALFGRLWGRDGWLRKIPFLLRGWTEKREMPAPAAQTFSDWWKHRET